MKIAAVKLLAKDLGVAAACKVVGVSRSTYYYSLQVPARTPPKQRRGRSLRRLPAAQRAEIRALLNSERFRDLPPRQIYATLLDEGTYVCHWRTMYNILHEYGEVRERRNQRVHPPYKKPELLATVPNKVWSWDITKLRGPQKWSSYKLFVMLDIYSRYVVGWMVAPGESAGLAAEFIAATCERQGIRPQQLTIHSDRGPAMISKTYTQLLADLRVERSYIRPYCSNDNAYSESQFKTMKYHSDYPVRFGSLEDARAWARAFFDWYNNQHYHSGLALMRPSTVHYGQARSVQVQRQRVLEAAYAENRERFPRGMPKVPMPPWQAWINKPSTLDTVPLALPDPAQTNRDTSAPLTL